MRAAVPDTTHKRFRQSANKAKNKRAKRRVKHPEEYWNNYICQKAIIADRKAEVRLAVHMAVGFRASHIVRSLPILPLDAEKEEP